MKKEKSSVLFLAVVILVLVAEPFAWARHEKETFINTNSPTYKLYQLLNDSYGGKLSNFYLLADVYAEPQNPKEEFQRVLRVDYDKNSYFGRFRIFVRVVGKLTQAQLKTYNAKQIYKFGESDSAEFEKIDPGPFGQSGDLYLKATTNGPLAPATITDQVRKEYEMLVTQYILPALEKK